MDTLSFAPLDELVQLLVDAGLSASTNPEDVNLPGAWVTVEAISTLSVDWSLQLECVVFLVVGEQDYRRAYTKLAELYNAATAAGVIPDGPVVPQGVVMPGVAAPMPALRVPINLI